MVMENLKHALTVSRISRIMDIPRSTIYYRKTGRSGRRKARISENIESEIIRISGERTTYGYRRIWAILRNSGIHVNIKTVRRIMRSNGLALPWISISRVYETISIPKDCDEPFIYYWFLKKLVKYLSFTKSRQKRKIIE